MGVDQQTSIDGDMPSLSVALSREQLYDVRRIIDNIIPGATIWVFGSRATGKARPFSNLDLLFTEPSKLTWAQGAALRGGFEASRLPFRVDVVESADLSGAVAERIEAERVSLPML